MSLIALPTLDQLAADPAKAATLSVEAAEVLLTQCHVIQGTLLARLLVLRFQGNGRVEAPAQDRPVQNPDPQTRHQRLSDTQPHVARSALLSVKEAARMLSCSEAAVRKWAYRRQLPAVKVGRLTRFRPTDVEALIARGSRPARADRP